MAFACIFIPDFPVQTVIRQEPELRNKPVTVLEGAAPLTKVVAANEAARARGVEVGMTKLQMGVVRGSGVALAFACAGSDRAGGTARLCLDDFAVRGRWPEEK